MKRHTGIISVAMAFIILNLALIIVYPESGICAECVSSYYNYRFYNDGDKQWTVLDEWNREITSGWDSMELSKNDGHLLYVRDCQTSTSRRGNTGWCDTYRYCDYGWIGICYNNLNRVGWYWDSKNSSSELIGSESCNPDPGRGGDRK